MCVHIQCIYTIYKCIYKRCLYVYKHINNANIWFSILDFPHVIYCPSSAVMFFQYFQLFAMSIP